MLNEPVTDPLAPGAAAGGQAGGGQMPGMGGMPMPDEASYIHVTQEEKQAIDRVAFSVFLVNFFCHLYYVMTLLAKYIDQFYMKYKYKWQR